MERRTKEILIAIIIFVFLIFIYYEYSMTPSTPSVSNITPVATTVNQYCTNGTYCDGTPVPQSASTVGSVVCGGNNVQYTCTQGANGPSWVAGNTCTSNMAHYCSYCTNGTYCDGTPVSPSASTVGSVVCGGNKVQYNCVLGSNNIANWQANGPCASGMLHGCS